MATSNAERRVSLTMLLLSAAQPLTKARIRSLVDGYAGLGDAAFNQAFERDKRALREMSLPIETTGTGEDEGYRIRPGDFQLEPVDLTPQEAAAVALAARSWRQAGMAASSQRALMKLRTIGAEPDTEALASLFAPTEVADTRPGATRELAVLRDAVASRRRVTFDYADRGTRRVEPWGLAMANGQWYLFGADLDRGGQPRRFKLARIQGKVVEGTSRAAFPEPDRAQSERISAEIAGQRADDEALVAIRPGREAALHRHLTPTEEPAPEGYRAWRVAYGYRRTFVGDLAALGTDVIVLAPHDLRTSLVEHLTAMLEAPVARSTGGRHGDGS
ncbi:proteasome accessory factor B [Raineyella antarctica]|uniref:Proteasome accessory factor B n=1 Tax=Raineyella antarctica TaxID=1577474 RepID=A0A1G6GRV4_9ACTN|nr:WYL domain-containing protein [Raineyella antarctica]SDB84688.1 proteasome accessory factor B [Raineyella antarctica]